MKRIELSVDWVNFGSEDTEPKKFDGVVIADDDEKAIEVLLEEISPCGDYDWNGATFHKTEDTYEKEERVVEWSQDEDFEAVYVSE